MAWCFAAIAMQCDRQKMIDVSTAFFAQHDLEQKPRMFLPSIINHQQAEWSKWLEIGQDPDTGWSVARWYQPYVCVEWVQYLSEHLGSDVEVPLICYAVDEAKQPDFEHYACWVAGQVEEAYTRQGLDCWVSDHLQGGMSTRFNSLRENFDDEPAVVALHAEYANGRGLHVMFDAWQEWVAPLSVQEMLTVCDEFATPFSLPIALQDVPDFCLNINRLSGVTYQALTSVK